MTYQGDDTIRERILADVQTTLSGITAAGGYKTDVASVERYRLHWDDAQEQPVLVIYSAQEQARTATLRDANDVAPWTMRLIIDGIHEVGDGHKYLDQAANEIYADILRAMEQDVSRGGVAVDTVPVSFAWTPTQENETRVEIHVEYDILYRTQRNDPTVAR